MTQIIRLLVLSLLHRERCSLLVLWPRLLALCRTMAESTLADPINSTAGSTEGSERAAIRERELKLRAAYEDGDFERYKELAIVTWPTIVGGVPKETKH